MDPSLTLDEKAQHLLKTLFQRCRDTRRHQQDVSELARHASLDFPTAKRLLSELERQGYVETLTFGQKVAFTEAGLVIAQRVIR